MQTQIEGLYRNGKIELLQPAINVPDETRVIITFIEPEVGELALSDYDIDPKQAETLRANLASFCDDWNSPEMSIYDNYDAAKAQD